MSNETTLRFPGIKVSDLLRGADEHGMKLLLHIEHLESLSQLICTKVLVDDGGV